MFMFEDGRLLFLRAETGPCDLSVDEMGSLL
jgi:hypothetical protein